MNFDNILDSFNIDDFSNDLHNFLNNITEEEPVLYTLDRVEGNIGILENRDTGKMSDVPIEKLPEDLKDGDIFRYFNGVFEKDIEAYSKTKDRINSLRENLKTNLADTTCLIVAQRIGTISNADKIIVLDEGKMVGQGTHKELLENCPVYKQIALSQLSKEEL